MLAKPSMVVLRNRLRKNPAARWLYQRWMANRDYEDRFGRPLLAAVDQASIVWDVGANVGLYTEQFLARGARQVICIEPAPAAVRELLAKFAHESRVQILPVALSNTVGTAPFFAAGAAPTNRLGSAPAAGEGAVEVSVRRAADLFVENSLSVPTVVKVDVEGYEWEVLKGFGSLLSRLELRAVFVEIHFSILHERGLDRAPDQIVELLERAGLTVRWLDLSHIEATRR